METVRPAKAVTEGGSLVDRARVLSDRLFALAQDGDEAARLAPGSWQALDRSRLALSVFPESAGGEGLGEPRRARELAGVLRLIGAGDLSMARLFEGHVNAVLLVLRYGSTAQRNAFADAVRAGALSAVWNAEGARPLRASPVPSGWRLEGEKILASGAGTITHPIVTPATPEGPLMLLLDDGAGDKIDLSRWTPQGMRATATGTIDLTDIVASPRSVIGAPGDYPKQPMFSGGAWRFCAVHLGAAERLVDLFRADLVKRNRHDDPYQRQRIASAVAATTTATFWVERAATLLADADVGPKDTVAFVNLTRSVTERACLDVIEIVQRGIGLGAFIRPAPIERIVRDLATYLRQPVPDAAMADAAAHVLASDTPTFDLWHGGDGDRS